MTGKGFCVKIQLHLHAVSCPGVWLCPHGKVALQINTLNYNIESQKLVPVFPLLFHEKFTFEKIFARVITLTELQQSLEQEFFYVKLVQWVTSSKQGIILATFETNLVDLLYPASYFKGLLAGLDIDLLMEPTKYFPGIIAPKIEVSTKTIIEGIINIDDTLPGIHVINPKTITSKHTLCIHRKQVKGIIRQKRVCHSREKLKDQNYELSQQKLSNTNNSHKCFEYPCHSQKMSRSLATYDDMHICENCPVCLKYKCYFSDYNNVTSSADSCKTKCKKDWLNNSETFKCICQLSNKKDHNPIPTLSNIYPIQKGSTVSILESKEKVLQNINDIYSKVEHNQMKNLYKNLENFYKKMYEEAKLHAEKIAT